MKKITMTLAACAALFTLPAVAGPNALMVCVIHNARAQVSTYVFRPFDGDNVQEISYTLNGWTKTHEPAERPLWEAGLHRVDGVFGLRYNADGSYLLAMENSMRPTHYRGIVDSPASMFKNGREIMKGRCGMTVDTPAPRRKPAYTGQTAHNGTVY